MATFKVDLLSAVGKPNGASRTLGGIFVDSPAGEYELPEQHLPSGWFAFRLDYGNAVLSLKSADAFMFMEFEASDRTPAYMKLTGGTYKMALCAGLRPGKYAIMNARLEKLSLVELLLLLGGRVRQAIAQRIAWQTLPALVARAFARSASFGIRSQSSAADDIGLLILQDMNRLPVNPTSVDDRLRNLKWHPIFFIRTIGDRRDGLGCETQLYKRYTFNHDEAFDYEFVLNADDHLLPDALLLFAEHINAFPNHKVVVSDKYISGRPSQRVAWDPLMYGRGALPTPYAFLKGDNAEQDFTNRSTCGIISVPTASTNRQPVHGEYAEAPAVAVPCSIIIPTRDRADLLEACLAGLFERTTWPHEVIIIDNGSKLDETFQLLASYETRGLRVISADIPFNFSTLCNLGAAQATHPYLVFLNNDVVLNDSRWLANMMAYAALDDVGAVGAKLFYADGRIQHAGVALGVTELCGHLWRGLQHEMQYLYPQLTCSSLRSAVTGACLCVAKEKFYAVGGFDEKAFPVTLNDIDLCLKLNARGWYTVFAARAEAFHLESESRGEDVTPESARRRRQELTTFFNRWSSELHNDPWVSRLISRGSECLRFR